MKREIYPKNERGIALVISLMFLAILSMLGTTAYVMTTTDLSIGRNYQQASQAFYGADAGVQYVLTTIENDLKNGTTVANGTANILPTTVGPSNSTSFTAASPSGFNLTFSNITMVSDSPGIYSFTSTSQNPNDGSKAVIDILFSKADHDPAFDVGILSEGDIRITGNPNIDGGIHSNSSVTQNGGGGTIIGGISAVGSTSAGSCGTDCTLNPGADRIDVPLITTADFNGWKTKALAPPNIYCSGTCTYSDPGAGNIYFADGDITFANNLSTSAESDVTIIATGDITASGSSIKKADGKVGLALIAGGDILFNGGGGAVLNATFWCNGDYRHNGAGTVEGAIVAGGSITRHGCFDFIQNNNIDNDNLPPSNECNVIAWSDSRP
jgi:Tfp pilus assembly protein PilX